jgi:hypothetical protein
MLSIALASFTLIHLYAYIRVSFHSKQIKNRELQPSNIHNNPLSPSHFVFGEGLGHFPGCFVSNAGRPAVLPPACAYIPYETRRRA